MEHQLEKRQSKNYCVVCHQSWKGKPRSNCLGVPTEKFTVDKFEEYRRTFWQNDSLLHLNLIPTTKVCCLKRGKEVFYFYDRSGETKVRDSSLPPVVERDYYFSQSYESSREFCSCLKNAVGLKRLNLVPSIAEAVAVYWDLHERAFVEVFNPLDCQVHLDSFPQKIYSRDPGDENIKTREQLRKMNLRPKANVKAVGALWSYKQDWVLYWHFGDCEPIDPLLPPVYCYNNIPQGKVRESRLYQYNRISQGTKPVGAVFQGDGFEMLYEPETCAILDSKLPPLSGSIINSPFKDEIELRRDNLQPGNAKPVAMYYAGSRARNYLYSAKDIFVYLFNPQSCEIYLKNPPPIAPYSWQHDEELLTSRILTERNLKPKKGVKPSYRYWSIRNDDWNFLWKEKNCEIDNVNLPPVVEKMPKGLYRVSELSRLNRKITENSKATACIWASSEFKMLYDPENCQILNPDLLPCYAQENLPPHLNSEWAWGQKEPLFKLKDTAQASGCFRTIKDSKLILLYDRTQLELHNREIEISQTKLKQIYKFDEFWLSKLGLPDRLQENPINAYFKPMRVYDRSRIENFLAKHASQYIEYLRKKRKLPTVFNHLNSAEKLNSEIKDLMAYRTMAVGQYQKCLNCVYGATIPQGFLCTIHHQELKQIPCPDWQVRR